MRQQTDVYLPIMLLAAIIILFSLLALGLLALLDRYDRALLKSQADRRSNGPQKVEYYNAFPDRRQGDVRPEAK